MKRLTFTAILSAVFLFAFGQVQEVMVIEKKDGTTLRMNVEDIERAVFESAYINPTGTVATAVDLGLPSGVKWASWNLGASSASEYGGYYGWADATGQKTSISVNDYPSATPPLEISGTSYDIAKALWGGQWRLPTYEDIEELFDNCNFYKSGNEIEVVGPNKNSIYFQMAGSREGTEIYDTENFGYYWTGTIHPDDKTCAWLLNIDIPKGKFGLAGGSRYFGLSVRPVYGTPVKVSVTTGSATNITDSGATLSGIVSGTSSAITAGIIYGTLSSLSSNSGTKKSTSSKGSYTITLSGLNANTTYYYCAYVVYNDTYYYGDTKSFTTKQATTGTLNGHEWVDLGLPSGTKWATCNVGASSSEDFGGYYAWGETTEKQSYMYDNYIFFSNYTDTGVQLKVSGTEISGTNYDVAYVKWGSTWRMPTNTQMEELIDKCEYIWTIQNGISGGKFMGPNGNSIFLPAAGYKIGSSLKEVNEVGQYYSSTSSMVYPSPMYLHFNKWGTNKYCGYETNGCNIRPVTK